MTQRTRTRGVITPISTATLWHYTGTGNPWVQNAYSAPFNSGVVESMTDSVTKGFRARQKAGEKFFNNMSSSLISYEQGVGNGYQIHDANNGERIDGQCFHLWIPHSGTNATVSTSLAIPADDISRAAIEVSTKVLSDRGRSTTNLWESIAEVDKTIAMLRPSLVKFVGICNDATRAKREGRFKGFALNGVSNLYLAYRYGIRPLVSDVQGILAGLKKDRGNKEVTTRARVQLNTVQVLTGSSTLGVVKVNYSNMVNDLVNVRAMSLDEVNMTALNNIGFSTKGLLTLPWELVPYSFVADWAFNIGDYLGALAPAFGWNSLGSCLSITRDVSNTYVPTSVVSTSGSYTLDRPVSGSFVCKSLTRGRGPLTPAAIVLKSDLRLDSATRAADAWALAGQLFIRVFGGVKLDLRLGQRYTE